jgi:hypothetical protein
VRAWPILAGVLAGLVAGGIWTLAQPNRYRADARALVRPSTTRIVPAVVTLAESSLVAANVAQTLHLSSPPRVTARSGNGGIVTVSASAGSRERARQIDAEAVVILTQKVAQRFGRSPGVTVTQLDPAHAAEQTSPTPGRNLLVTGLIGLAAGLAVTAWRSRGALPRPAADAHVEGRIRRRIEAVAQRERALARRAGELAVREKELERRAEEIAVAASRPSPSDHSAWRRERELEQLGHELEERERELERRNVEREAELTRREVELAIRAEEPAEPPPPAADEPAAARPSRWNLDDLERLVREGVPGVPVETAEEWRTYLQLLRGHAAADGRLPAGFEGLLNEVFADVIPKLEQQRSTEP